MYNFVYYYLANFLSYGYLKAEKGQFLGKILGKTGLFRPLNGHNSKNSKDKHTKLYIFEILRRLGTMFVYIWATSNSDLIRGSQLG